MTAEDRKLILDVIADHLDAHVDDTPTEGYPPEQLARLEALRDLEKRLLQDDAKDNKPSERKYDVELLVDPRLDLRQLEAIDESFSAMLDAFVKSMRGILGAEALLTRG